MIKYGIGVKIHIKPVWKWTTRFVVAAMFASVSASLVEAEPHSPPVQVLSVRSYAQGSTTNDIAYITTTNPGVCNATGNTGFYVSLSDAAGQAMLSIAITALSTGTRVTVEVSNATGCSTANNGGAIQLQSLVLLASGYPGPY